MILGVCVSCGKRDKIMEYEKSTYLIDIDSVKRENTFRTSDLFKKINVIILEDHEYALISDITEMQIIDDKIYILDAWQMNRLYVYDRITGKYLKQIGSRGQGPEEYLVIMSFCIDTLRKELYVLDDGKFKIHKYDVETGKYLTNIDIPSDIYYRYISFSNNKLYLSTVNWYYEQNDNCIASIDLKTKAFKRHISGNKYNLGWQELSFNSWKFFVTPDKYVEEHMNTVFILESDTVRPYLTIKCRDWIKKEYLLTLDQEDELGTERSFYADEHNQARHIHNYIERDDYIYFEYDQKGYHPVLFNKNTGEIRHYEDIMNDLLVTKQNVITTQFIYTTSKAAYDVIKPFKYHIFQKPKLEFVSGLDKRNELIKLLSDDEEHCVIFEYEFK